MYCQMFSTGFNSGALAGSGRRVMLAGTTRFLDGCQPAWSTRTRACAPGATACAISFRCKVMPSVVQRGRTKPCSFALSRADCSKDVGRGGPLVLGGGRARAAFGPASGDLVLLPDPRLIGEPDL